MLETLKPRVFVTLKEVKDTLFPNRSLEGLEGKETFEEEFLDWRKNEPSEKPSDPKPS